MTRHRPPRHRGRRFGAFALTSILATTALAGVAAAPAVADVTDAGWAGATANPYGGTDYFLDATGGDDAASGTSEATAWKSLAKANDTTFLPGDRILLKGGETWSDQQLWPKGSGEAGKPIVIDAYGDPEDGLPYIATNGNVPSPFTSGTTKNVQTVGLTGAVNLRNQEYVHIANLELSNDDDFATDITRGSYVRDGVSVSINADLLPAGADTIMDGIVIRDLHVHDIDGPSIWQRIHYGGVNFQVFGSQQYGAYATGGHYFRDIEIVNNTFERVELHAIQFGFNWFGDQVGYNDETGKFHEGWEQLWVRDRDLYSRNVHIAHNYAESIGQGPYQFANTKNLLAEYNEANGWLQRYEQVSAGLYLWAGAESVMRFNEIYDGPANQYDATPWDLEFTNFDVTYEYNYSHDNKGGWMAYMGNSGNSVARYNLSVNDNGVIWKNMLSSNYSPTYVLNNVFVYDGSILESVHDEVLKDRVYFANNIFYNTSTTDTTTWAAKPGGLDRAVFSNNAYYEASGEYSTQQPKDDRAVIGDPIFVGDPADYAQGAGVENIRQSASIFRLDDASPLVDAGRYNERIGEFDFFGDPSYRGDAPDIGLHETANGPVVTNPVDDDPIEEEGVDTRVDLALGKTATASSTHPHQNFVLSADKLVDGDPTTRWAAADDATFPLTIDIDFGAETAFDEVVLDEFTDSGTGLRVKDFALQSWNAETEQWEAFVTRDSGIGRDAVIDGFGTVTSSKLRLSITSMLPGEVYKPTLTRISVYRNADDAQPVVTPAIGVFDRNPAQADNPNNVVEFTADADGATLDAIRYVTTSGAVVGSLDADDYTVTAGAEGVSVYRLTPAFYADKMLGTSGLIFEFSAGNPVRVTVEIVDTSEIEALIAEGDALAASVSDAALDAALDDARALVAKVNRTTPGSGNAEVTQVAVEEVAGVLSTAIAEVDPGEGETPARSISVEGGALRIGVPTTIDIAGFVAGEEVELVLHSEPVLLATLTIGADGTAAAIVTVPDSVDVGEHTLTATGPSGLASLAVTVTAAPTDGAPGGGSNGGPAGGAAAAGPDGLASTGSDFPVVPVGIAAALLLALGVLMVWRRRSVLADASEADAS